MFQKPILTHYLQQRDAKFVAEKFATNAMGRNWWFWGGSQRFPL